MNHLERIPKLHTSLEGPALIFHKVWWRLKNNYAFFELREVDWDLEYHFGMLALSKQNSFKTLQKVLRVSLSKLNDGHVKLCGESLVDYVNKNASKLGKRCLTLALNRPKRAAFAKGQGHVGRLLDSPNLGYLRLDSFEAPVNRREMRQAFQKLDGCQGLVLDLRFNSGGYDELALHLLGHFTSKRIHCSSKRIKSTKGFGRPIQFYIIPVRPRVLVPVVVLTSPLTASAAEVAVIAANRLHQVSPDFIVTLGLPTEGILSDIHSFKVGPIEIDYSREVYFTVDGKCYEAVGVPPVLASALVPRERTQSKIQDRTNSFVRALEEALNKGKDPDLQKASRWLEQRIRARKRNGQRNDKRNGKRNSTIKTTSI